MGKKGRHKGQTARALFLALCRSAGLPEPIPEYRFAWETIRRRWRIDYYFEYKDRKVALEVEGGVWTSGRHVHPSGFLKDMEKYNALTLHGIFLLRTTPAELMSEKTVGILRSVLLIE